jgi:protein tyrosine phosphatase (PTP) superfamily phosphohydrolase (DUF442 family)
LCCLGSLLRCRQRLTALDPIAFSVASISRLSFWPTSCKINATAIVVPNSIGWVNNLFLSGQFSPDDIDVIKRAGIERIISLRTEGEVEWDEKGLVEAAGIEFRNLPVAGVDSLTDEFLDQTCLILKDAEGRTLIHCGIVGRAAAVWIAHRVLNEGISIPQAEQEAAAMFPQLGSLKKRVLEYVEQRQTAGAETQDPVLRPQSVKPGINDSFLDPQLDPLQYVDRFEVESREVYESRLSGFACFTNSTRDANCRYWGRNGSLYSPVRQ